MSNTPPGAWPVLTARQAAAVDSYTIHSLGLPGAALMETAGRAVFNILREWQPDKQFLVLAGPGNNGGDGFVVARYLHDAGLKVSVACLTDPNVIKGDAALHLRLARSVGVTVGQADPASLTTADRVIVDALFGTGLARPLEPNAAAFVERCHGAPVLAIDIPSGIDATTGRVLGTAVKADRTVTFGTLKTGHLLYPGADHCGRVTVADIGFPHRAVQSVEPACWAITPALARAWLPARPADANKGSAGRVVLIGGNSHYTGAPVMASEAALHIGAGLSTVAVPQQAWLAAAARLHEVIVVPLPDEGDGYLGEAAQSPAEALLKTAHVAAFGPGLGRQPASLALIGSLLASFQGTAVVDADGLRALKDGFKSPPGGTVITPHPGEMATLLGLSVDQVLEDPLGCARDAARRFGVVAVLKGSHTVVADVDGQAFINCSGNSGMASAGMGDVLTGVVAGLLAQGMSPLQAAVVGVYVHGVAGDQAAMEIGRRGLVATDVSKRLPRAVTRILDGDPTLPQPAFQSF